MCSLEYVVDESTEELDLANLGDDEVLQHPDFIVVGGGAVWNTPVEPADPVCQVYHHAPWAL